MANNKRKGIYLLPNLLTTAGLFSGFYAIVASISGQFESAAIAIFVAMIFDGLDGRVARMTNTQSDFGAQYDSMADIVSFVIAPALVMYNWALFGSGKLGWLAAFVFVAGGALRLARFNTNIDVVDKRYFQGLATPAAAALVAGLLWVGEGYQVAGTDYGSILAGIMIVLGILMVSNFRYHSFKDLNWHGKVPFIAILVIMLIFVIVATEPALVLFVVFALYAISGPINTFRTVEKVKLEHVVGDADENDADFHHKPSVANDSSQASEGADKGD